MDAGAEYQAWLAERGVTHAHCQYECSKPQPFLLDGILVCGKCATLHGVISAMIPCTPDVCN